MELISFLKLFLIVTRKSNSCSSDCDTASGLFSIPGLTVIPELDIEDFEDGAGSWLTSKSVIKSGPASQIRSPDKSAYNAAESDEMTICRQYGLR